jgi:hypothetical protein
MNHDVEQHGFTIVSHALAADEQRTLLATLGPVSGAGHRGLLALTAIVELARSPKLLELIRPYLPCKPFPVRAIYFDKSSDVNWLVPWHQDLSLAVRDRAEVPGFGPWSRKDGIPHVQPPVALLEQMLTVRLHLDDTDESSGALRVLPGSHRLGRLSAERIQQLRTERSDFLCAMSAGDALLMRPLLLHASTRSTTMRHRRVLHIEYAAFTLPHGLEWHEAA